VAVWIRTSCAACRTARLRTYPGRRLAQSGQQPGGHEGGSGRSGRAVAHDLGRYLPALGTIASVAPLLGLLGTVIGMVEIFGSQTPTGGNPAVLAHGISVALYNTAFGLIVAIPA
jgi:biopolymer transport protein ExbB/TolQ